MVPTFYLETYLFAISAVALCVAYYFRPKSKSDPRWWTGMVVEGRRVKVRTDQNLCMGASSCVTLAPEVFHIDWEKKRSFFDPAPLQVSNPDASTPERIFRAAQSCPYRAIVLEDADTGERIYP